MFFSHFPLVSSQVEEAASFFYCDALRYRKSCSPDASSSSGCECAHIVGERIVHPSFQKTSSEVSFRVIKCERRRMNIVRGINLVFELE
jgi:hypothetical protein